MDLALRCNSLKCRTRLTDRAVVTTCSHIFCVPCSDALGLSSASSGLRVCPACDAQLGNPDDAVVTQLNPTEDYKTSVLSGLSPTIVMECCSRGMSFYQYQVTQEIMYHDYMAKNLTDRYANLNAQMDNVIKDANSEITALREKLEGLHMDKRTLEQKNQELIGAFSEKSKAHQRLQKLYQQAKSTQDARYMRHAAADDTENVIQSLNGAGFVGEVFRDRTPQRPSAANVRGEQDMPKVYSHARVGSSEAGRRQGSGGRADRNASTYGMSLQGLNLKRPHRNADEGVPGSSMRQMTPNRQQLDELHRNTARSSQSFDRYGVAGGAAMGRNIPHGMHRQL